jgi:hypothetical protein
MKKLLFIAVFLFIASSAVAQSWTPGQYTEFKGVIANEVMRLPRRDTIALGGNKDSIGQIIYRPADTSVYVKTILGWRRIAWNTVPANPLRSVIYSTVPTDTITYNGRLFSKFQLPELYNKRIMQVSNFAMVYFPVSSMLDFNSLPGGVIAYYYDAANGAIYSPYFFEPSDPFKSPFIVLYQNL